MMFVTFGILKERLQREKEAEYYKEWEEQEDTVSIINYLFGKMLSYPSPLPTIHIPSSYL